jgi:hypothetical protein
MSAPAIVLSNGQAAQPERPRATLLQLDGLARRERPIMQLLEFSHAQLSPTIRPSFVRLHVAQNKSANSFCFAFNAQ